MRGGKIVVIRPKYTGSNAFIEYIKHSKLSMLSYDSLYGLIIHLWTFQSPIYIQ
jgi:hypothetical protein